MARKAQATWDTVISVLNAAKPAQSLRFNRGHLISFLLLLALWIVFSGRFDGFHLAMGVLASALVARLSGGLIFTRPAPKGLPRLWGRLIAYLPWLLYQIFRANLHVLYLVFHPRMMDKINPKIIKFDSRLKSDYARTLFANAITLTPGTITVDVTALGRFAVHCIDDVSGDPLPGQMEERIARVFEK
ncbi:MAG: Na+/H+ antiporter subunit E [Desulfosarcinaceae bacterium]|nr:Na+/H+ antiporter subunit E [Desulfosarcinaceae bacterium]